MRVYVRLQPCRPPLGGPHPRPAAACAAPTRRVCAATQLARGSRPPGRGPGRKTLPTRGARGGGSGGGGGGSGIRRLFLRLSETWCPQGPACMIQPGSGRRRRGSRATETWRRSPFPFPCAPESCRGYCARAGSLEDRGGVAGNRASAVEA